VGVGDPEWPKTAYAQGGKYAYTDDQQTPNTLLASYDYGGREIAFEVRWLITGGGEGTPVRRPGPPPAAAASLNITIGNLFYGTEGWAAMSDGGFQAFKGD